MLISEVQNMKNLKLTKVSSVRSSATEIIMTTGKGIFRSMTVSHIVYVCLYMDIYKHTEGNPHIHTVHIQIYTHIPLYI